MLEEQFPSIILAQYINFEELFIVNYDFILFNQVNQNKNFGLNYTLAQKISEIIKYPIEASIGYPTPGSFGTYAGVERQISTITLELDEICPVENLIEPVFQIFKILK